MKQIIVNIDDLAYEPVVGMLKLCQGVEIESESEVVETRNVVDRCVAMAIRELQDNHVFKRPSDFAYIMLGSNDGVIKGLDYFFSPDDFTGYLEQLGFTNLPSRSTIYNKVNDTIGKFPNWNFVGEVKPKEILRRKNIVTMFVSAYGKAKRQKLDGFLDK